MGDCIVECKYVDVQICQQNCVTNFVTKFDDCPCQVLYYDFLNFCVKSVEYFIIIRGTARLDVHVNFMTANLMRNLF